jgi:hypothetical protein
MKERSGVDAMLLKIFLEKILEKKMAILNPKYSNFMPKIDHNLGFQENRHFSAEKMVQNHDINIDPGILTLRL